MRTSISFWFTGLAACVMLTACVSKKVYQQELDKNLLLSNQINEVNDTLYQTKKVLDSMILAFSNDIDSLREEHEQQIRILSLRHVTHFDTTVNKYIGIGNSNVDRINNEYSELLTEQNRTIINAFYKIFEVGLKDYLDNGVEVSINGSTIDLFINSDLMYNADSFTLSKFGNHLNTILNKDFINELDNASVNLQAFCETSFTQGADTTSLKVPSNLMIKLFSDLGIPSDDYSNIQILSGDENYFESDSTELIYDRFVLHFVKSLENLKTYFIREVAQNGEVVDPTHEIITRADTRLESSGRIAFTSWSTNIADYPELSYKYLFTPFTYRMEGFNKSTLNDSTILSRTKLLHDENQAILLTGRQPEVIKCDRSYAIIVVKDDQIIAKSPKKYIECGVTEILKVHGGEDVRMRIRHN